MREFKFRAWAPGSMQMVGAPELFIGDDSVYRAGRLMDSGVWETYKVMQWTGLKDKNEVDIYEGDILRTPANDDYEKKTYNSFEIFWHDNDCTPTDVGLVIGRMSCHGNSAGGYGPGKLIPKTVGNMIVIGNIFENKELLNHYY